MTKDSKLSELSMAKLKGITWRTEPVPVAIGLGELWIGVKGQSNLV